MYSDFSNMLSQLRRDRFLSQRKVAEDLNVSQALLSHYENGIREPRLDFVVRACEYYGVSSDYLLGLSTVKTNPLLSGIDRPDDTYDKTCLVHSNDEMHRLVSAIVLLFGLLSEIGDDSLIGTASLYLSTAYYKIFRALQMLEPDGELSLFKAPDPSYKPLSDASLKVAEMIFHDKVRQAETSGNFLKDASEESLKKRFPALYNEIIELIEHAERHILKFLD